MKPANASWRFRQSARSSLAVRLDVLSVTFGKLLPPFLAHRSLKAVLVPNQLILRHGLLGELFGPGAERETGSDVADCGCCTG